MTESLWFDSWLEGSAKVEEAGVVLVVGVAEVFDEARVDAFAVHERLEEGVVFDAAVCGRHRLTAHG